METVRFSKIALALLLGVFAGAVAGVIVDSIFNTTFFSKNLLTKSLVFEFYIVKLEWKISPASIIGFLGTVYYIFRKRIT